MKHMTRDGEYVRVSNTEAKDREKKGWKYISKDDYRRLAGRGEEGEQ